MPDARLLRQYLDDGMPHGEPICLSFGESWDRVPPALAGRLGEAPRGAHGYQLSLYGLPRLREALAAHLRTTHELAATSERGRDWDVAVSWTGTRSAMFDFGRLVHGRGTSGRRPVVVAAGPAWDYEGVFAPLGFEMRYVPLRPEFGFAPRAEDITALVDEIAADGERHLAMVIVNAQHNPTAVNWSSDVVAHLLDAARATDAAVLVDDAYFGVHDRDVQPTSALRMLLEARQAAGADAGRGAPWLAVRSMGKQFGCNGWGIGSIVAAPDVLDRLVNVYRLHHTLMASGPLQHAMAGWLESTESTEFLSRQRGALTSLRATAAEAFIKNLDYPGSAVYPGTCTPYIVIELPPAYAEHPDGATEFRALCFQRTSVLIAPIWPWPMPVAGGPALPHLRVYLGAGPEAVTEATRRMRDADLGYHTSLIG